MEAKRKGVEKRTGRRGKYKWRRRRRNGWRRGGQEEVYTQQCLKAGNTSVRERKIINRLLAYSATHEYGKQINSSTIL